MRNLIILMLFVGSCTLDNEYTVKLCSPDGGRCLEGSKKTRREDNGVIYWDFNLNTNLSGKDKSIQIQKVDEETIFFIKWGKPIEIACRCDVQNNLANDDVIYLNDWSSIPYVETSKGYTFYSLQDFETKVK